MNRIPVFRKNKLFSCLGCETGADKGHTCVTINANSPTPSPRKSPPKSSRKKAKRRGSGRRMSGGRSSRNRRRLNTRRKNRR